MRQQTPNGYIALASVLVIGAAVLIIGTSVSLLAVNHIQASLADQQSQAARNVVDGCVEDALLRLNENDSLPSTIPVPEGTCSVTLDSQAGDNWTFTVEATVGDYTKSAQVSATRDVTITITDWREV